MIDLEKQLKKGSLEIFILQLFLKGSHYGYQIIQELKEKSGGFFDLKEGTLYPILYRLEDAGWIESYWVEREGRGVPKKYYRITKSGKKQAKESLELWNKFQNAATKLLGQEK